MNTTDTDDFELARNLTREAERLNMDLVDYLRARLPELLPPPLRTELPEQRLERTEREWLLADPRSHEDEDQRSSRKKLTD